MNERIRELAEQCREAYPDTEWPDAMRYRFDEKKFAELIVKECADVCRRFGESGDGYTCSAEIFRSFRS